MKWKLETQLNVGETRWRVVFAWRRKVCRDNYVRWLCRVGVFEEVVELDEYLTKLPHDYRRKRAWYYDAPTAGVVAALENEQ